MEMPGVIVRRCRSGAGQRWSFFSVPWAGGEAQRAGERRKKKALWAGGKKSKSTPIPLFIPRDQGRGGRGKSSTTPTVSAEGRHMAAWSGAVVTVTVPLGHHGLQ
jgi:hypothetical protein